MDGYNVEARPDAVHRGLKEVVEASPKVATLCSFRAVRNATAEERIQPPEPQLADQVTPSNRPPPSPVANSPTHSRPNSFSASASDELFPLLSATEMSRLPFPDRTVIRREMNETRSWILAEGHTIVCEIENVASVVYRGNRTYDVRNGARRDMAFVRDADAYHTIGWHVIFYRFGEA
jgi:hypothetical protein